MKTKNSTREDPSMVKDLTKKNNPINYSSHLKQSNQINHKKNPKKEDNTMGKEEIINLKNNFTINSKNRFQKHKKLY